MNDKIKASNNFTIGSDFELHSLKGKGKKEKLKGLDDENTAFLGKKPKSKQGNGHGLHEFGNLNLGFYLVTPLLAGVLLGSYLDGRFGSRPVWTLVFIFLGMAAMFYNLFRLIKKN